MAIEPSLVEREAAWRAIEAGLRDLGAGQGGIVLVEGRPGTGRTALLRAARRAAVEAGLAVFGIDGPVPAPGGAAAAMVLVADDADDLAPEHLSALGRRTATEPLLLLAAASGHAATALRRSATSAGGQVRSALTAPLSAAGSAAVLRALVPDATADEVAAWHLESGGLPVLLAEVALRRPGGRPSSATSAFAARSLERAAAHEPAARLVAAATAVLGAEATLPRLVLVTDLAPEIIERAAQRLIDEGVFRPSLPPAFDVPVIGAAVLAALSLAERSSLEVSAAALLRDQGAGPEAVAAHLVAAGAAGRGWVVDVLQDAAARARRDGNQTDSVRYLRRALLEPPAGDRRVEVLTALASAEAAVGDPSAPHRLEEALQLVEPGERRADLRFRLGRMLVHAGEVAEGLRVLGLALEEVGDTPSELAYRIETAFVAAARIDTPSFPLARARLAKWRDRAPEGATAAERTLLAELAYLEGLEGRHREGALDLALRALGGRGLAHLAHLDGAARHVAMLMLFWAGELDLVDQAAHQVVQFGRQHGNRLEEALAHDLAAAIAQERGEVEGTTEAAERYLHALGEGSLVTSPSIRARLAQARLDGGDLDAARSLVESFDTSAHEGTTLMHLFLVVRARIRLAAGDAAGALADASACGRMTVAIGNRNPGFPQWRAVAVRALARLGRTAEARRLADEEVALARAWGLERPIGVALTARATVLRDEERVDALREAVAVLRRSPARLELARALAALAEALAGAGRDGDAGDAAEEAVVLAEQCGARLDVAAVGSGASAGGSPGAAPPGPLEVRLLDGFELRVGGEAVALRGVPATLVKVLALARRPMHVEQVADVLWSDGDPASRTRLRNVLTRLRRVAGDLVVREGEAVRLAPTATIDVWTFSDAASALLGPGVERDDRWLAAARRARAAYRGDLLPEDPFAEWAERPRATLSRLHLDLLDALARTLEERDDPEAALEVVRAATEADPLDERRYLDGARLADAVGRSQESRRFLDLAAEVAAELGAPARPRRSRS